MSTAPAVATLQGAAVQYARTSSWVPQGTTLSLRPGTTTLLLGPSGCGKSTLTRLLPGLVPHCLPSAYRGSVRVCGQEVADAEVSHLAGTVAVVMQDPDAQVVTTSVLDEVCYALENLCVPAPDIEPRARRALADVGLSGREATSPWELSGGQRQRLVLACALAQAPSLLVLDEPTANLDPAATAAFFRLLPRVQARGAAVLVVEHDLDDVIEHVTHVLALGPDGDTLACGPTHRVLAHHGRALARAGVRLPSATRLGHRLQDAGLTAPADRAGDDDIVALTLADGARQAQAVGELVGHGALEELVLGVLGADEQEVQRSVSERLERFGLSERAGVSPFLLSGGQQRRLSVASVLGRRRDLICLDEPTFGQDQHSCDALMALLRSIADEGTAVVLTTHDMGLVAEHADRVLVLADGRALAQGSPEEVLSDAPLLARAGLTPPPLVRMRALAVATGATVPPLTRWEDLP
ncbi:ATP-binding cassette domain-containing protein [Actinomyces sp. AC-19-1]|uniref:ABC transporter ATP-binding protein n=1 Tax=Actinomyces sp. 217892 TaxID=2927827 RepID=UPI002016B07F|nr:ATP-binding cassette domain-containing protein [Actinomyces sp. 217892]MCL3795139.1 ATP-binding cassette domain-containing protein [Actinomyces sp. 217892]